MSATESSDNYCKICCQETSKYVCPRCNIPYCSLTCYRSKNHAGCSEDFYRECVVEELAMQSSERNPDSRRKMEEMLLKLKEQDDNAANLEVLDSDDSEEGEESEHLSARLAGVNLDDADTIWECLSATEKTEFIELLNSGNITSLLPEYAPWWESENKQLVEELHSPEEISDIQQSNCNDTEKDTISTNTLNHPLLIRNIPSFTTLCKNPSPVLPFNTVSMLSAYAYTVRCFNGEHLEWPNLAASVCWNLSPSLSLNCNYQSFDEAVAAASLRVTEMENANEDAVQLMKTDLMRILSSIAFIRCAFSDLVNLFRHAILHPVSPKNSGQFSKKFSNGADNQLAKSKLKLAAKKLEFYLSWALDIPVFPANVS